MKKSLFFLGLLAVGFASAQTDKAHLGKAGINTMTPQATIDIRPNADNSQETATTNEGILIPKLSKTRVANIEDALLVEGTLVYVTDEAASTIASYTGTNAKVAKITEKGYYFYSGTEWVKAAGDDINIYNSDGTLTGNRKVVMGDKILSFEGSDNEKYLEVKNASWYPLVVNSTNAQGGGIAVHPNNLVNRIEFSTNEKGDMRFYQYGNGDVMFAQKSTNRIGIGTTEPKAKLDIEGDVRASGSIASTYPDAFRTAQTNWGAFFRNDDTNLWLLATNQGDPWGGYSNARPFTYNFLNKNIILNSQATDGNVGIGTYTPAAKLDIAGQIKITDGTQQEGRVLTSDANGLASWQALSMGNKTSVLHFHSYPFSINTTPYGGDIYAHCTREVATTVTSELNEIGLTYDNEYIHLKAGKYFIFLNHDINSAEYCLFRVIRKSDNAIVYATFYGEWLNTSFLLNLETDDSIAFEVVGFADSNLDNATANPSPIFYKKADEYINAIINNKVTILKLN